MPPAKTKPEEWFDLLIEKGPALRAAGYLEIELEGCTFTLAPAVTAEPEHTIPDPTKVSEDSMTRYMDALDDPETYNRSDGTTPGWYSERRQGPMSNDNVRISDG